MTLEWFTYKDGSQGAYWSGFKKESEFAMLATQFIGGGDGYHPKAFGPFTHKDGKTYTAVEKTSKKTGKPYWEIKRIAKQQSGDKIIDSLPPSEEAIAHQNSNSEGAKKGHEENVAMHKEEMAIIRELITAVTNLNETIIALGKRMDASEGI